MNQAQNDPLIALAARASRLIAEVWPAVGPKEEVHYRDGHYATQFVVTYSLVPLSVHLERDKVWIPAQEVIDLIVERRQLLKEGLHQFPQRLGTRRQRRLLEKAREVIHATLRRIADRTIPPRRTAVEGIVPKRQWYDLFRWIVGAEVYAELSALANANADPDYDAIHAQLGCTCEEKEPND